MKVLTEDAVLICGHDLGIVDNRPTQDLVTIAHRRVLVDDNPENRPISKCPNVGLTILPCLLTLRVEAGYSEFVRIEGKRICLDTVTGLTNGTPPGTVKYRVREPGQELVVESGGA